MTDPAHSHAKISWHLWVVGGASLLWNAMGVIDFMMTQTKNEAYMGQFTPEQIQYFYGFPMWAVIAWALATWSSLVGSILLLFRSRLAVLLFLVSIAGMAATTIYNFVLTDGVKVMGNEAAVMIVFSIMIWLVAVLLLLYARAMRRCGVLH